eukprot:TRINITY_DN31193_c0_g1_i1.p1 TRINITY_DN31193_c0_g1~~TRINITY_DN31193_c0_g1_i1.p1  ORF type:complete len:221 (-),score=22.69 TRINITY_DN31193_c0_g1_i1:20-598(-)
MAASVLRRRPRFNNTLLLSAVVWSSVCLMMLITRALTGSPLLVVSPAAFSYVARRAAGAGEPSLPSTLADLGTDGARTYFSKLGWTSISSEDEDEYISRFRVISAGLGGFEEGYRVVKENSQVLLYGNEHLIACIMALQETLGNHRAADVITKNPAVLTISAPEVRRNYEQIATVADGMGFMSSLGDRFGLR